MPLSAQPLAFFRAVARSHPRIDVVDRPIHGSARPRVRRLRWSGDGGPFSGVTGLRRVAARCRSLHLCLLLPEPSHLTRIGLIDDQRPRLRVRCAWPVRNHALPAHNALVDTHVALASCTSRRRPLVMGSLRLGVLPGLNGRQLQDLCLESLWGIRWISFLREEVRPPEEGHGDRDAERKDSLGAPPGRAGCADRVLPTPVPPSASLWIRSPKEARM
jgi:hypothetical protein